MKLPDKKYNELIAMANNARGASFSPYSHFAVGAALLSADGRVYTGANIENASFGATMCAERVAIYRAISEGARDFLAIAICGRQNQTDIRHRCPPCGMCLQVLSEFCDDDFEIVLESRDGYEVHTLGELLPIRFGGRR